MNPKQLDEQILTTFPECPRKYWLSYYKEKTPSELKRKLLIKKILLFVTSPFWGIPWIVFWELPKFVWEEISDYVDEQEKPVYMHRPD